MSPWAAFLSVKAKGLPIRGDTKRRLGEEFRNLTLDERESWKEEAWRMTLRNRQRQEDRAEAVAAQLAASTTAIQALRTESILSYCPGASFEDRLQVFSLQVRAERRARNQRSKTDPSLAPADPTVAAADQDPTVARDLVQYGGPGLHSSLRQVPSPTLAARTPGPVVDHFIWQMPAIEFAQDPRFTATSVIHQFL